MSICIVHKLLLHAKVANNGLPWEPIMFTVRNGPCQTQSCYLVLLYFSACISTEQSSVDLMPPGGDVKLKVAYGEGTVQRGHAQGQNPTSSGKRHLHGVGYLLLLGHAAEVGQCRGAGLGLSLGRCLQPRLLRFCHKPDQVQSATDQPPSHVLSHDNIQMYTWFFLCVCVFYPLVWRQECRPRLQKPLLLCGSPPPASDSHIHSHTHTHTHTRTHTHTLLFLHTYLLARAWQIYGCSETVTCPSQGRGQAGDCLTRASPDRTKNACLLSFVPHFLHFTLPCFTAVLSVVVVFSFSIYVKTTNCPFMWGPTLQETTDHCLVCVLQKGFSRPDFADMTIWGEKTKRNVGGFSILTVHEQHTSALRTCWTESTG